MSKIPFPNFTLSSIGDSRWAVRTEDRIVGRIVFRDGVYWSEETMTRGVDDLHSMAVNIVRGWD